MYIFVPSYSSIFFALSKVIVGDTLITVLTNNKSVQRFVKDQGLDTVFYDFDGRNETIISDLLVLKRTIKRLDKSREFYLLDDAFAVDGFFFAKNWTVGKVFFENLSTKFELYDQKLSLKEFLKREIYSRVFNLNLIFRKYNGTPVFGIDSSFVESNSLKKIGLRNYGDLKHEVIRKFQVKGNKVDNLWVSQGTMASIVTKKSLNRVFEFISSNYNLGIKEHPKHISDLAINKSNIIKDYIPVEFYLTNVRNAVVSVYSLSLLSSQYFPGLKAISILELVEWCDLEYKNEMKKILIKKSNDSILFPKTIEELKTILLE